MDGMISKEELNKWIDQQIKKKNWLQVQGASSPDGRQSIYMTAAGQFVVVQYDLYGKIRQIGQPIAMPTPVGLPKEMGFTPR